MRKQGEKQGENLLMGLQSGDVFWRREERRLIKRFGRRNNSAVISEVCNNDEEEEQLGFVHVCESSPLIRLMKVK